MSIERTFGIVKPDAVAKNAVGGVIAMVEGAGLRVLGLKMLKLSQAQAEVSAYFTPDEWWELGGLGILREQQRVYVNFLRAMDEYV